MTEIRRCDNCNKDIDESKWNYHVEERKSDSPLHPDFDFCNLGCLHEWVEKAEKAKR